jgi:plastocyanin
MSSLIQRRRHLLVGALMAAALAMLAAACSGGDDEAPTPTQPPAATTTRAPAATQPPAATATRPSAPTAAPAGQTKASDIRNFQLESFTIRVGTSVVWTNRDGAPHTATSGTGTATGVFNTGNLNQNQASRPILFDKPGTFPYFCEVHGSSMSGTVTVTP